MFLPYLIASVILSTTMSGQGGVDQLLRSELGASFTGADAPQASPGQLEEGWPRRIEVAEGEIIVYQPQIEALEGDRLTARAAVAITPSGQQKPVFGAVFMEARVETDRDARTVTIDEIRVPRARIPEASRDQEEALTELLQREIPASPLTLSLDRLLTSLELAELQRKAAQDLGTDPPRILLSQDPALLVTLDGPAEMRPIPESGIMRVVNTPFLIALDPDSKAYFLFLGQGRWMTAPDVEGAWVRADGVPGSIASLAPPDSTAEASGATVTNPPRRVFVATEPTELIVTEGEPTYTPLQGSELLFVSNTDSDIFMDIDSQLHFLLLSGRWYTSGSLQGPWTHVPATALPAAFARIPVGSPKEHVLVHVPGTDQAVEAVLDAHVPQTSAVRRDATIEVEYDGEPTFNPIEGTDMEFAVNTTYSVLRIEGRYYVCHEAVWYESDRAVGPWTVSVVVPDEVESIPPSAPVYNVKYVKVYDSSPEVVYVGYTPGYTGCYVYGPTVVYGTGYWYRGWVGPYYYYPRPVTYGFHVRYNPWYGWSFGFSWGYGPFTFGFSTGGRYSYWGPRGPGGWWGPGGYPRYGDVNINTGDINIGRRPLPGRGDNIYNRPENRDRIASRDMVARDRADRGLGAQRPGTGDRPQTRPEIQQPRVAPDRENNVFTDRDGNVYRRSQEGWERRESDGWRPTDPSAADRPSTRDVPPGQGPGTPATRDLPTTGREVQAPPSQRPSVPRAGGARPSQTPTRPPQTSRPSTGRTPSPSLNREYSARQRGSQRVQTAPRAQPRSGGARPAPRRR